jgi:hypothetical protein
VFVTTGNGPRRSDGFAVVKLSRSLKKLGKWTAPRLQGTDSDFGGSAGVWRAKLGGVSRIMVGACNKNGVFYALRGRRLAAGLVWKLRVDTQPNDCLAAPIWDGSHLYIAGNSTTVGGKTYDGSIRRVAPATGHTIWQTGLSGSILGTPSKDGAGVIAAASFGSSTNQNGVFLINAANGKILKTIPMGPTNTFGQPVFADNKLIVASTSGLRAYVIP